MRIIMPALVILSFLFSGRIYAADFDQKLEKLRSYMSGCMETTGYNSARSGNLGDHELGAGERKWRECVYQGIRDFMIPGSEIPNAYSTLISRDKVMTDNIEAKKLSRNERKKRLDMVIASIKEREVAAAVEQKGADQGLSKQQLEERGKQLEARMAEIERMRQIQSMMVR
jgi:hypothetical protein